MMTGGSYVPWCVDLVMSIPCCAGLGQESTAWKA